MDLILKFLKSLSRNNNREWFEKNKAKYQEAKLYFDGYVGEVLSEVVRFDESLAGLDPKKLTFRIYRDVRFSKDKRPYKTNFGAAFSSVGKGMGSPGYYLHIEPGNKSFAAGGLFMPEPDKLAKVRQEIDYNGESLVKIMKDKKFRKYYRDFWNDEAIKKAPKGYPKDHPHIDWIKLKSFVVTHEFTDKEVTANTFKKTIIDAYRCAKPLNDFLTEATS